MFGRRSPLAAVLPLSLLVAMSGCYQNIDSFAAEAARQSCRRMAECDRGSFEDRYDGDMGRCRDDVQSDLLDTLDLAEDLGCEYDPDQGRTCINTAKQLDNSCGSDADKDIGDACDDVMDCPGLSVPHDPLVSPSASVAEHIMAPVVYESLAE